MISNEGKIKEEENIKEFSPQKMEEQNTKENNQNVNQCLPKFLTMTIILKIIVIVQMKKNQMKIKVLIIKKIIIVHKMIAIKY